MTTLSPDEQATVDRIEAAPDAEESLRERVARAIHDKGAYCGDCSYNGWESCRRCRRLNREYADAAIAVMRSQS